MTSPSPSVSPEGRIHWLTDIPSQWQVVPSKWLFAESKRRARADDLQLSATQAYGVIPQEEFERRVGRQVTHSFLHQDKRKHVEVDDFVVSMRSFQGGLERAWATGAIRSSYVVLRPSPTVYPPFFAHMFKSTAYIQALQATSNFIRDGQDLNFNNFVLVNLPEVPLPTQKAIANFLDRKTAAIDALVEKKQKLLDLLTEKRAALINQAVTKGLDPNVPMKDSGIPWIGEIPAHWQLLQCRRVIRELCDGPFGSGLKSQHYTDGGVRVIRLQNIRSGCFDDTNEAFVSKEHFRTLPGHEALPGDLLIAGLGDTNNPVGRACRLPDRVPIALVKADCYRARLDESLTGHQYVAEYLSAAPGTAGMLYSSRGATRTRINLEIVRDAWLAVPPLTEQRRIVARCASIREAWQNTHRAIVGQVERLQEYRQALITAAVTGQLDIPEEAP